MGWCWSWGSVDRTWAEIAVENWKLAVEFRPCLKLGHLLYLVDSWTLLCVSGFYFSKSSYHLSRHHGCWSVSSQALPAINSSLTFLFIQMSTKCSQCKIERYLTYQDQLITSQWSSCFKKPGPILVDGMLLHVFSSQVLSTYIPLYCWYFVLSIFIATWFIDLSQSDSHFSTFNFLAID